MRFAAVVSLFISLLIAAPVYAADDAAQASAFVDKVASQALSTIKDKQDGKLSEDQAKINFRKILNDAFDVPTIARFTLGRYWRVATPEQQQEYTRLIKTVILDKYADRILSYSGNGYKITNTSAINDKDYAIAMNIDRASGSPVDFGWRLRKTGAAFKVIDISVEGISMSVTHRTDFASVIERNGGNVDALLTALKNKDIPDHGQ